MLVTVYSLTREQKKRQAEVGFQKHGTRNILFLEYLYKSVFHWMKISLDYSVLNSKYRMGWESI